ncbi:MAG TPA: copper homeostasis membrane protein CopD [Xanthobacteraceae bacterium]|nr:copper homeostasis membrane protein CopD [Xanthobacteraceae bacterium]
MTDPLFFARALHFAATLSVAGVVFFIVLIAEPALRGTARESRIAVAIRARLAWIAWVSLIVALVSAVPCLVIVAQSMSGQPLGALYAQGVLGTVLTQTDFGNDWLLRVVLACALGGLFVHVLDANGAASRTLRAATVILAAAYAGGLAWTGHAIGGQGTEGVLHPAADVLHLIAAAAWVGGLLPLALLLTMTRADATVLAVARTATRRFSNLGIASVAALIVSGLINSWYLVGSIPALTETDYGRLLLIKLVLFLVMVGIAAVNWSQLTPKLVQDADLAAAQHARRRLRRNAAIEAVIGTAIVIIVAVLGTLPPASHIGQHTHAGAIPADATFQHIHGEDGMADVTIEPGRVGTARATIQLWDGDFAPLTAREVTLTLTAPGSKPVTRTALQNSDGAWIVNGVALTAPGNWMVAVHATLPSGSRLDLEAPIVVDAK